MKEEDSLLAALFDYPHDQAAWLVYADWLEERGDSRAEYLRLSAQLRRLSARDPQHGDLSTRLSALRPGVDGHWLALIEGGQRFSVLWTSQHGRELAQRGLVGKSFPLVYGGYGRTAWFAAAGVQSGDYIYPLYEEGEVLYLAGRLRVREVLGWEQYRERYPGDEPWLASPLTGEVALGEATPLELSRAVPREVLERFSLFGRRSPRRLAVTDGRLTRVGLLRGVQRLDRKTARDLDFLLAGRPAPDDGRSAEGVKQASLFDAGEADD